MLIVQMKLSAAGQPTLSCSASPTADRSRYSMPDSDNNESKLADMTRETEQEKKMRLARQEVTFRAETENLKKLTEPTPPGKGSGNPFPKNKDDSEEDAEAKPSPEDAPEGDEEEGAEEGDGDFA